MQVIGNYLKTFKQQITQNGGPVRRRPSFTRDLGLGGHDGLF
jgi:hypothetical protein